jgi:hypothetical protein
MPHVPVGPDQPEEDANDAAVGEDEVLARVERADEVEHSLAQRAD